MIFTRIHRIPAAAVTALAAVLGPLSAAANGAAPRVRLEQPPPILSCETADGAVVAIDEPRIGGNETIEIWEGPIRRKMPIVEVAEMRIGAVSEGATGVQVIIETVRGTPLQGEIRFADAGEAPPITGREHGTNSEVEIDLLGCARLVASDEVQPIGDSPATSGPAGEASGARAD